MGCTQGLPLNKCPINILCLKVCPGVLVGKQQGGGSLPVEETRPSPSRGPGRPATSGGVTAAGPAPPGAAPPPSAWPRGYREGRRARRSAADIPPHGFPGGSPPAAARQLPPASHPPRGAPDPPRPTSAQGGPAGAAAHGRRGAQPGPRARRPGAAATERLLAREHVSRKRARSRPEFPTAGRARAHREAESTPAINARPPLIPRRPRPPSSCECPGSFQGWLP